MLEVGDLAALPLPAGVLLVTERGLDCVATPIEARQVPSWRLVTDQTERCVMPSSPVDAGADFTPAAALEGLTP